MSLFLCAACVFVKKRSVNSDPTCVIYLPWAGNETHFSYSRRVWGVCTKRGKTNKKVGFMLGWRECT